MKAAALFLLPAALLIVAATRDRGPGVVGVQHGNGLSYAVDGFDAVSLGGAAKVDVRVGPNYSVRAEGPAAAFANFRIVREDSTLEIGRRYEGEGRNDSLDRDITVHVTLPRIVAASIGGSGSITVDRIRADRFRASLGGSGTLALGTIEADRADLSIGGSGDISAAGHVRSLDASVGGSGHVRAGGLSADSARVSMAGSGSVRAAVRGPATVSVVGSGDIDLGSGARCTTSRIGHGTVHCGG